MVRRALLLVLTLVFAAPLPAVAQTTAQPPTGKMARIGVLSGNRPDNDRCLEALRRGLTGLGYTEGKTHVLEVRWSEGRVDLFPLSCDLGCPPNRGKFRGAEQYAGTARNTGPAY